MDGDAFVIGLHAATLGVARREGRAYVAQQRTVGPDLLAFDKGKCLRQRPRNGVATRYFAEPDMAKAVCEDDDIAGEERRVGATEVEQHAVVAGNRHYAHSGDNRRGREPRATAGQALGVLDRARDLPPGQSIVSP
jgi:hypothetical protein